MYYNLCPVHRLHLYCWKQWILLIRYSLSLSTLISYTSNGYFLSSPGWSAQTATWLQLLLVSREGSLVEPTKISSTFLHKHSLPPMNIHAIVIFKIFDFHANGSICLSCPTMLPDPMMRDCHICCHMSSFHSQLYSYALHLTSFEWWDSTNSQQSPFTGSSFYKVNEYSAAQSEKNGYNGYFMTWNPIVSNEPCYEVCISSHLNCYQWREYEQIILFSVLAGYGGRPAWLLTSPATLQLF